MMTRIRLKSQPTTSLADKNSIREIGLTRFVWSVPEAVSADTKREQKIMMNIVPRKLIVV